MTTDQPRPGCELDEAIAKALGWKEIRDTKRGYRYGTWVSPEADVYREEPLPYSTDTATALAMLEQLCKPKEEGGRGWTFQISHPGLTTAYWVELSCFYDGEASTLAHATALVILAALEAEK